MVHPFPNSKIEVLSTLYDPTHLFKNIRNNWMTEKMQMLEFCDPETNEIFTAKWKDLVKNYKAELESDLKQTKLDYVTKFILITLKNKRFTWFSMYSMRKLLLC